MVELKVKDILEICNGKLILGNEEDIINGFKHDTREVEEGDTYVGVKGENLNGSEFYEKPDYKIMTNFSPYKQDKEKHDWMGWDRYKKVEEMLKVSNDDFDVSDCFDVLKAASQTVCPTVVSMVYDASENIVYWCENRKWDDIKEIKL